LEACVRQGAASHANIVSRGNRPRFGSAHELGLRADRQPALRIPTPGLRHENVSSEALRDFTKFMAGQQIHVALS
jgi:hypothetical protein